jgi:hypothetical protein
MKKAALRRFAWRYDPNPEVKPGAAEYFSCEGCLRVGGIPNDDMRAAKNCALPDFDTSKWTGKKLMRPYMGAPTCYQGEKTGQKDWKMPKERPDETGCPGSWYRTDFVRSVLHYYRRKDDHGGRIVNRYLDQTDDSLVIEAINTLEVYESNWRDKYHEMLYAK